MAVAPSSDLVSVPIHGVRVHDVTMSRAIELIDSFVRGGAPHHVVTLDASMCVLAERDPDLARIVRSAELVTPDSAGVLWACRRTGHPLHERVSGVELLADLAARSAERDYRLFLLGAAPGVADDAAEQLAARFSGCQIVGTHDGYFPPDQDHSIVDMIVRSRANVLFVAMGIPKQEKWIDHYRSELAVPVMIGVGGSFDVWAGRASRAPRWIQRLNMEWLYRLATNPRKIRKVLVLPRFVMTTLLSRRR